MPLKTANDDATFRTSYPDGNDCLSPAFITWHKILLIFNDVSALDPTWLMNKLLILVLFVASRYVFKLLTGHKLLSLPSSSGIDHGFQRSAGS